jgi:uncharacterized OsmC-like protein
MDTEGAGANPIDTLLASLASCVGHRLRDFFRDYKIASNGFTVSAEAGLTGDKSKLADIRLAIDLKDTAVGLSEETALMGYVESCKIHCTLSANSRISAVLQRRP